MVTNIEGVVVEECVIGRRSTAFASAAVRAAVGCRASPITGKPRPGIDEAVRAGVGLFIALVIGVPLFWPAMLTYTFLAGEPATAQVAECHHEGSGRARKLVCTGTWRTAGGDVGAGEIYGLDEEDAGHRVAVRIGPMGPYANGFLGSLQHFILLAFLVVVAPIVWRYVGRSSRGRAKLARQLLAEPPGDATVLVLTRSGITRPDGTPYASWRKSAAPPGHRPLELPGRRARQYERSTAEWLGGLATDRATFLYVDGPAGEPLFLLEVRTFRSDQPEAVLLDLGGAARALIRDISPFPPHCEMLRPDGTRLATAEAARGIKVGSWAIRDEHEREMAIVVAGFRRLAVCIQNAAPSEFRDLSLAFAISRIYAN
jgi:hypothetical protein